MFEVILDGLLKLEQPQGATTPRFTFTDPNYSQMEGR
jgi:hypothetical protein